MAMLSKERSGGGGGSSKGSSSRSSSSSNSNNSGGGGDLAEFQRMAANSRVVKGNAQPGDTYRGGSASQQQRVEAHLAARQAQAPNVSNGNNSGRSGNINDYVGMITDAAFGGGPRPRPVRASVRFPSTGATGGDILQKQAPVPRNRPDKFNEDLALDEALNNGIPLDNILAGAAGAAAALAAQRLFRGAAPNSKEPPTAAYTMGPNSGTTQKPGTPAKSGNILTRNGLQSGVPTMNPDINAQFYEIFGLPMPSGLSPNGNEPRLIPGPNQKFYPDGTPIDQGIEPYEGYVRPQSNTQRIPGPNQNVKQLGDMDSPTYRDNFGYNDTARQAQEIFDKMEMYGDYDLNKYVDSSVDPAVARQVQALIRGAM